MDERDREPSDYPLRPPQDADEAGSPETTEQTGAAAVLLGVTGLAVLAGIVVVVVVALAFLL